METVKFTCSSLYGHLVFNYSLNGTNPLIILINYKYLFIVRMIDQGQ